MATSAAHARGPQGRSWGGEERSPAGGRSGPGTDCKSERGSSGSGVRGLQFLGAPRRAPRRRERGLPWPDTPPPRTSRGRALTVRVLPLASLFVVHPAEPLQVVIVAAPRPVHRHHGEVRHRALGSARPGRSPSPVPGAPSPAPRPRAFLPAALTSSARPPGRPSGRGSRRDWGRILPGGPRDLGAKLPALEDPRLGEGPGLSCCT